MAAATNSGTHAAAARQSTALEKAARGDQAAFAQLYDRVAPQVYGLVKRVIRDPAQSEEVAQEVLLEVWRTAPSYGADRGTATTWVLTLAHRRAVDRVRSEQASRNRTARVAHAEQDSLDDDVAETVEIRMEQQQVCKALGELTDPQRQAVELAYYGGYTYRDIAELLNIPLGNVKTWLRDGLIRLRDTLAVDANGAPL